MNADPGEWGDIGLEEEKLLSRCRKFVLSSPDSPGGGPKDILYYTPCRRWLRVCSRDAFHGDACQEELSWLINSIEARRVFDKYGARQPPELDQPDQGRDAEVAADLIAGLTTKPVNYTQRKALWRKVRNHPGNLYFKADLNAPRPRGRHPVPDDPKLIIGAAEEKLERNSLVEVLREWSREWPESIPPQLETAEGGDEGRGTLDESDGKRFESLVVSVEG